jgi:hypothetical protein
MSDSPGETKNFQNISTSASGLANSLARSPRGSKKGKKGKKGKV